MQSLKLLFSIVLMFVINNSWAVTNCPTPHPRYSELLNKIKSFAAEVNRDQQCNNLSQEFTDLSVLYSDEDFNIIRQAYDYLNTPTLTEKDKVSILSRFGNVQKEMNSILKIIQENQTCAGAVLPDAVGGKILNFGTTITSLLANPGGAFSVETLMDLLTAATGINNVLFPLKDKCPSIAANIDQIKIIGKNIFDQLKGFSETEKKELDIESINRLGDYSEKVTTKVGSIISSLINQPKCLPDQKTPSVLSTLASVTKQMTTASAAFSGPYGVPLRVGGSVISGILKGIDTILERRNLGYNFKYSDDRQLFINNLCSYHNIRSEINDVIDPVSRVVKFSTLVDWLNEKEEKLVAHYPECSEYQKMYYYGKELQSYLDAFNSVTKTIKEKQNDNNLWQICSIMGMIFSGTKSEDQYTVINQLSSKIDEAPEGDFHVVKNLLSSFNGTAAIENASFLTNEECWRIDNLEELKFKTNRSISLFDTIMTATDSSYKAAMQQIIFRGEKKHVNGDYLENYVDWLKQTYEKRDWAREEIVKMQALLAPGSAAVKRDINENAAFLDDRILYRLAPRFMQWYAEDVNSSLNQYNLQIRSTHQALNSLIKIQSPQETKIPDGKKDKKTKGKIWGKLNPFDDKKNSDGVSTDHVQEIMANLNNIQISNNFEIDHSQIFNQLNVLIREFLDVDFSIQTLKDYCSYFKSSGTMNAALDDYCAKDKMLHYEEIILAQFATKVAIEKYVNWAHENALVSVDSVEELILCIKKFNQNLGSESSLNNKI